MRTPRMYHCLCEIRNFNRYLVFSNGKKRADGEALEQIRDESGLESRSEFPLGKEATSFLLEN